MSRETERLGPENLVTLASEIVKDSKTLMAQEAALLKFEFREGWQKAKDSLVPLLFFSIFAVTTSLLISLALVQRLIAFEALPIWSCYTLVALLFGLAALVTLKIGKVRLDRLALLPQGALTNLKENIECLKTKTF